MKYLIYKKGVKDYDSMVICRAIDTLHYRHLYYIVNHKIAINIKQFSDLIQLLSTYVIKNTAALIFLLTQRPLNQFGLIGINNYIDQRKYYHMWIGPAYINYQENLQPYITSTVNYYDNLDSNNALTYYGTAYRSEKFSQVEDLQLNYQDNLQYKYNIMAQFPYAISRHDFTEVEFVAVAQVKTYVSQSYPLVKINDYSRQQSMVEFELEYNFLNVLPYINRFSEMTIHTIFPSLKNQLFYDWFEVDMFVNGTFQSTTGVITPSETRIRSKDYLEVTRTVQVKWPKDVEPSLTAWVLYVYNFDKTWNKNRSIVQWQRWKTTDLEFKVEPNEIYYIKFGIQDGSAGLISPSFLENKKVIVEAGEKLTTSYSMASYIKYESAGSNSYLPMMISYANSTYRTPKSINSKDTISTQIEEEYDYYFNDITTDILQNKLIVQLISDDIPQNFNLTDYPIKLFGLFR